MLVTVAQLLRNDASIRRIHVVNFQHGNSQHAAFQSRSRFRHNYKEIRVRLDELVEVRNQVRTIAKIGDMYSKKCLQRRTGNGRARA